MAKKNESILEVAVSGVKFRLRAAEESHAGLRQVAAAISKRIQKVQKGGAASSLLEAAMMVAFQIGVELQDLRDRCEITGEERDSLTQKIDEMLVQIDQGINKAE